MSYISPYSDITSKKTWSDLVKHEYSTSYTRATVTIEAGYGILTQRTILGKNTSTGKYAPVNPSASDGTEVADAILYTDRVNTDGNDAKAAVLIRGPAIISFSFLISRNPLDDSQQENMLKQLETKGIICGEEI
jgi:hypothetical protein